MLFSGNFWESQENAGIPGIPCQLRLGSSFTLHQEISSGFVCRLKQ
ncbi:hypothetical protein [Flavobacterium sp.]